MKETVIHILRPILAAIRIHSGSTFSIGDGTPIEAGSPGLAPEAALLQALQTTMYYSCYVRKFSGARRSPLIQAVRDGGFAARLSGANYSRERWDRGWTIDRP